MQCHMCFSGISRWQYLFKLLVLKHKHSSTLKLQLTEGKRPITSKQGRLLVKRLWSSSTDKVRQGWQRDGWKQHSHGSLLMNCGPGLCCEGGGLGVPTSLFLAILVLALANSSRRVWGISGSNRTPWDQMRRRGMGQQKSAFMSRVLCGLQKKLDYLIREVKHYTNSLGISVCFIVKRFK